MVATEDFQPLPHLPWGLRPFPVRLSQIPLLCSGLLVLQQYTGPRGGPRVAAAMAGVLVTARPGIKGTLGSFPKTQIPIQKPPKILLVIELTRKEEMLLLNQSLSEANRCGVLGTVERMGTNS